jgi:hypothetical protein
VLMGRAAMGCAHLYGKSHIGQVAADGVQAQRNWSPSVRVQAVTACCVGRNWLIEARVRISPHAVGWHPAHNRLTPAPARATPRMRRAPPSGTHA